MLYSLYIDRSLFGINDASVGTHKPRSTAVGGCSLKDSKPLIESVIVLDSVELENKFGTPSRPYFW